MPDLLINCYTIRGVSGAEHVIPLQKGIEIAKWEGSPSAFVVLGENCGVRLSDPKPSRNSTHLLHADFTRDKTVKRRPVFMAARSDANHLIIHVIADGLKFGFVPLSEKLNLWPGGDGYIMPFKQYGEHKNFRQKQQLFHVPDGASIFVVDECAAVARVSCTRGVPTISQPDVLELVEFLFNRAIALSKVQATDWAMHNLRALLGVDEKLDNRILDKMTVLNRLR